MKATSIARADNPNFLNGAFVSRGGVSVPFIYLALLLALDAGPLSVTDSDAMGRGASLLV